MVYVMLECFSIWYNSRLSARQLSYITFNYYSAWARYSYRTAFVAAAATYGIVVYKAYRARARVGSRQQGGIIALAGDENVQYLGLSSSPHGQQHSRS